MFCRLAAGGFLPPLPRPQRQNGQAYQPGITQQAQPAQRLIRSATPKASAPESRPAPKINPDRRRKPCQQHQHNPQRSDTAAGNKEQADCTCEFQPRQIDGRNINQKSGQDMKSVDRYRKIGGIKNLRVSRQQNPRYDECGNPIGHAIDFTFADHRSTPPPCFSHGSNPSIYSTILLHPIDWSSAASSSASSHARLVQ